jgi:hypothetical protein
VYQFVSGDFADPAAGDDVEAVELLAGDADRAASLASSLSVNITLIYSAALCTGLARLQGSTARIVGPFT